MAIKSLVCPNCNGRIDTFDETTNKGFCPYCDSLLTNVPELQQKFALDTKNRVIVSGIEASDEKYKRIYTFKKLGLTADALQVATEYADEHPEEFRAWRALCDLKLDTAISPDGSDAERKQVSSYVSHLTILASTDEDEEYLAKMAKKLGEGKKKHASFVSKLSQKRKAANDATERSKQQMDQTQHECISASSAYKHAGDFATKGPGRIAAAVGVFWFFVFSSQSIDFWLGGAIIAAIAAALIVNAYAGARKKEACKTVEKANEKLKEMETAHQETVRNLNLIQRELETENGTLAYINEIQSIIEKR